MRIAADGAVSEMALQCGSESPAYAVGLASGTWWLFDREALGQHVLASLDDPLAATGSYARFLATHGVPVQEAWRCTSMQAFVVQGDDPLAQLATQLREVLGAPLCASESLPVRVLDDPTAACTPAPGKEVERGIAGARGAWGGEVGGAVVFLLLLLLRPPAAAAAACCWRRGCALLAHAVRHAGSLVHPSHTHTPPPPRTHTHTHTTQAVAALTLPACRRSARWGTTACASSPTG